MNIVAACMILFRKTSVKNELSLIEHLFLVKHSRYINFAQTISVNDKTDLLLVEKIVWLK